MVRLSKRKVCERIEEAIEWSLSPEQLIHLLDKRPYVELYNAIYLVIVLRLHQTKLHDFGQQYATETIL